MSQTQQTQDTNANTSKDSTPKGRKTSIDPESKPVFPEEVGVIVDTSRVANLSEANHESAHKLATQKLWLKGNVDWCKASVPPIEWLEVPEELLKHFCGGSIPASGYFIYENVKLCLKGKAEEIAKRDGLNSFQVLFPDDAGKMRIR